MALTPANRLLLALFGNTLKDNSKYRNRHAGETCYVFGNGYSLRFFDFKDFSDHVSIGCNSLFAHSDFGELNCRYYQIPAPFFYPYRRYYGQLKRNYLWDLYREKIDQYPEVEYFTSLSNIFSVRGPNVRYEHHFGCRHPDVANCKLDGMFSFAQGALHAMLGTAIYMGFSKAILVGCDYTLTSQFGHFFENFPGEPFATERDFQKDLFQMVQQHMELQTLVPPGLASSSLNGLKYEALTKNGRITCREAHDIIDARSRELLKRHYPAVI